MAYYLRFETGGFLHCLKTGDSPSYSNRSETGPVIHFIIVSAYVLKQTISPITQMHVGVPGMRS